MVGAYEVRTQDCKGGCHLAGCCCYLRGLKEGTGAALSRCCPTCAGPSADQKEVLCRSDVTGRHCPAAIVNFYPSAAGIKGK